MINDPIVPGLEVSLTVKSEKINIFDRDGTKNLLLE